MSSSGVIRTNGLDGAPHMAFESSRRHIEPADIAFANANKHRLGWQTMAKMRGVNMHDLRRACDKAYAEAVKVAAEPQARPAARAPAPVRQRSADPLRVLSAIVRGAASYADLTELLGCSRTSINNALTFLKRAGWLAGHARSYAGWVITEPGHAALRKAQL